MRTVLLLTLLATACAADPAPTETTIGAVSSMSNWIALPDLGPPSPKNAAAFANNGARWGVAVAAGGVVYSSYQTPAGTDFWHAWTATTPPAGVLGTTQPALINLPSGRFLVVVTGSDQQLYAQEQDAAGTVTTAWHVIQPGALFREGPSIAFNPSPQVGTHVPTLMILGRGLDDHLYSLRNLMNGGTYVAARWGFATLLGNVVITSRPAVVDVCGPTNMSSHESFIAAGLNNQDFPGQFQYWLYDGSTWSSVPFPVFNGTFVQGPALACAGSGNGAEISIWGTGQSPFQAYHSEQISGGPGGFTVFGNSPLDATLRPTARAFGNALKVGVWTTVQDRPFYANATSP